jgi:quinolinate synthase
LIALRSIMDKEKLQKEIQRIKKEKNAIILAHYYQEPAIQEVADYIGDSLGLSQQAANTDASLVVFAGVRFMAETAKILNPGKKVVLPEMQAGCSLEDSCQPEDFKKFIEERAGHAVVTYVNCSAEIKAMSDIVCTSSNAEEVIHSIPEDQPIIFAPDINLGKYLQKKTGRKLILWNGSCIVHEAFSIDRVQRLKKEYPNAKVIAHPESTSGLLDMADYIGSTAGMILFVKEDPGQEFIVATEAGILHQMMHEAPGRLLIPAPVQEHNACACSECPFMKMNTLEKLYQCLAYETPEIIIDEALRMKAFIPVQRMLNLNKITAVRS